MSEGDEAKNENWFGFGREIRATAGGLVVAVLDDQPDDRKFDPSSIAKHGTMRVWGNYVVIDQAMVSSASMDTSARAAAASRSASESNGATSSPPSAHPGARCSRTCTMSCRRGSIRTARGCLRRSTTSSASEERSVRRSGRESWNRARSWRATARLLSTSGQVIQTACIARPWLRRPRAI